VFCYAYYVIPPPTSGTITIEKHVIAGPSGANPAFPFQGSLSFDPSGFALQDGQSNTVYRAGGETWTVTESTVDDYRLASIDCTAVDASGGVGSSTFTTSGSELAIHLVVGDRVTCAFTNTWIPPTGGLRITKITDGGVGKFSFDVTPDGAGATHTVTAATDQEGVPTDAAPSLSTLEPGTYTITEHQPYSVAGNWRLTGLECDQVSRAAGSPVTVTITRGTETACAFTNTFTPNGSITISKVSEGGTGTAGLVVESLDDEPVQYLQRATTTRPGEPADATPDGRADATDNLALGSYRIIEQPPLDEPARDWALTSINCNGLEMPFTQGETDVALTRSQPHLKCVFTNTFSTRPPPDPEPAEPAEPVPPTPEPPAPPEVPSNPEIPSNSEHPPGPTKPESNTRATPGTPWTDLSVTSRTKTELATSGAPITDVVTVTNNGPGDAERPVLTYQTLNRAKLVSVHTHRGQCGRSLPLICKLGTLKAGQKRTIRVVLEATRLSGLFTVRDAVGTSTYDPRLINNAGLERVYIEPPVPHPPRPIVGPGS
jgi:hypothetical protein